MNTKKFILLFFGLILAISAQSSTVSVCGIPMGTEKKAAEKILEERFGSINVREESGNLAVDEGFVGGVHHEFLTFYFSWINGKSILNGAKFSNPFELNEQNKATEYRDYLKSIYAKKYRIREDVNEFGFKVYYFGDIDSFCGIITTYKSKSKDGKTRFYTDVIYFAPYDETCDI